MPSKHEKDTGKSVTGVRLSELSRHAPRSLQLIPNAAEINDLRVQLDLLGLSKVRLEATLEPVGKQDWDLSGRFGATVTQPCVVTLKPVRTRLDEVLERKYRAELPDDDLAGEVEMPEDDSLDALPDHLDLMALLTEALGLALPPYPRAADAALGDANFTEPGEKPMTDDDAKPFAALNELRDKLKDDSKE